MPVTGNNNTQRINFGMARVYVGTTAPGYQTNLTLTLGAPADGYFIGLTNSECVFKYTPTFAPVMVEQTPEEVAAVLTTEHAELDCDFAQTDVQLINKALSGLGTIGSGNNNSANNNLITVGGLVIPTYTTVVAIQQRRDDTSQYNYIMLYRCYVAAAFSYLLSRTKPSSYKVTFKGVGDLTRTVGDQLYQWQAGLAS